MLTKDLVEQTRSLQRMDTYEINLTALKERLK